MSGHPDPHTLALWAGGDLDSIAKFKLAPHVNSCAQCRQTIQELERAKAMLQGAFAEPFETDLQWVRCGVAERLKAQRGTKRWSWFPGTAFAALAVFVSIAVMRRDLPEPLKQKEPVLLPIPHVPMQLALTIPDLKRVGRPRPTHNPREAGLRTVNLVARTDGTTQFRITTADPNVVILLSPMERTVEQ